MVKVMHYCPEAKKAAGRFLIEQMLNIEQQIYRFRMSNEEIHKKILKIISVSQKMKRQNEYFSQILFSKDEYGHHFDNMKIVINQLIEKIGEERDVDNIGDCLKMIDDIYGYQMKMQGEIERKKGVKESMRKIGEIGIAPGQIRMDERNPLNFFGDLFTNKQIEVQRRKGNIMNLEVIVFRLLQNQLKSLQS